MNEIILILENSFTDIQIRTTSNAFIFCNINSVKCDFINHSTHRLVKPIETKEGIRLFSIEDVAAMKFHAICGRGSRKDFYDIYFLLQQFSLKEMLAFYDYKFNSDNSWMALRSLQYFEDADHQDPPESIQDFPSWNEIKQFITDEVNGFSFNIE
ncbi:MAG: nucleotidyl transferase AbiEii/AbiGii toxin family protein [Bacteroidota bacterium]